MTDQEILYKLSAEYKAIAAIPENSRVQDTKCDTCGKTCKKVRCARCFALTAFALQKFAESLGPGGSCAV